MQNIRTFIAFETPLTVREIIIPLENQLRQSRADVRWESPDKFHITIKFLGDVDEPQLPDILTLIDHISHMYTTFKVVYNGLGAFPNKKQPKVVWIGCENPDGILAALKDALDRGLAPKGFEIEHRPYHPHLTLGRIRSPQTLRDLTPMLENLTFEPQSIQVKEIVVMKSILQPQGAVYTLLKKIQLR